MAAGGTTTSTDMAKPTRKRRTREHVLEDLSINHVERQILLCGWLVERILHDYGLDLELYTFDKGGEVHDGWISLQLKASGRLTIRSGAATFPFRIDQRDLVYWLANPLPVILIVYDGRREIAYWLYVQSYFAKWKSFSLFTAGATVTVQVPTANVINPSAVRRFARFRDHILKQLNEVDHDEDASDPLS